MQKKKMKLRAFSGCESLEPRQMFALIGVNPTLPLIQGNDAVVAFDPATHIFSTVSSSSALHVSTASEPFDPIQSASGPIIQIQVGSGGTLIGGNPSAGPDLSISGTTVVGGATYIGSLLTGSIEKFGFSDASTPAEFDFIFHVTGGSLASLFSGSDIGLVLQDPGSTYDPTFTTAFSVAEKPTLGAVPISTPNFLPGSIRGVLFCDDNLNGTLDTGETGLQGAVINLTGTDLLGNAVSDTATTLPDGSYNFSGLNPGSYTVQLVQQSVDGTHILEATGTGAPSAAVPVTLTSAQVTGVNFADVQIGSLTGTVFNDVNNNGVQDSGEPGVTGATLVLAGKNYLGNAVSATVTSGANGGYTFGNLLPSNSAGYTVTETAPAGYFPDTANTGSLLVVLPGCDNAIGNKNFGERLGGSVSGVKYEDTTGNGLGPNNTPLAGDVPLAGVTINLFLDRDNNAILDSGDGTPVGHTITAANGTYAFNGLAPGRYFVEEVVPSGYIRTSLNDNYTANVTYGSVYTGDNFANFETDCDRNAISCIYYVVNGCNIGSNLTNVHEGDVVSVYFTIKPGYAPHPYSLASYTAPDSSFKSADAAEQKVISSATGVFGPGTNHLTVQAPMSDFQIDFVCGAVINQFGPAGSNVFYTPQGRLFGSVNAGCESILVSPSSISGYIFNDANHDGVQDNGEVGISGVKVYLTGTDIYHNTFTLARVTDQNGYYSFLGLQAGTYALSECPPPGFIDGTNDDGTGATSDGSTTKGSDKIVGIVLGAGQTAVNFDFGDVSCYHS